MESGRNVVRTPGYQFDDACAPPLSPETTPSERKLELAVLFTSVESTVAAMQRAESLLRGLDGHIHLIEVQIVPRQLPLEKPPISLDFTKRRLLAIADESNVETSVCVFLCRIPFETLKSVLKPGAAVVLGCRTKWWPTWERKLAGKLRRAGYEVMLVESS
jgi:hypothetical protein